MPRPPKQFRRKRPEIDTMLLQRNQMFIRHPDRRLLIVSYKKGRTFINEWDWLQGDITTVADFAGNLGYDGLGWDLRALAALLDGAIGRVCLVCGRAIDPNRFYCSSSCRQAAYRSRK